MGRKNKETGVCNNFISNNVVSNNVVVDQNTPLFEKQTESLTTYQMNFLRAIIDGVHSEFTTQEVLQKYQLGSSANVSIVKRALVKKELVDIEKRRMVIPDPVLKVWLKRELGA